MEERIVYVDESGVPTGETAPKLAAHDGQTRLHLAFSCYIFNEKNELLVTQRALVKKVWPGVWSNSVCGHPMPGELIENTIKRRLDFELGMEAKDFTLILPKYTYKTPPFKGIIEHEFCPVFAARMFTEPKPNPEEVEAYKWLSWEQFIIETLGDKKDVWSWWCKDQIKLLKDNATLKAFLTGNGLMVQ